MNEQKIKDFWDFYQDQSPSDQLDEARALLGVLDFSNFDADAQDDMNEAYKLIERAMNFQHEADRRKERALNISAMKQRESDQSAAYTRQGAQ